MKKWILLLLVLLPMPLFAPTDPSVRVPDGGSTAFLAALGFAGIVLARRCFRKRKD